MMALEASQLLTPQLRPHWKSQKQWNRTQLEAFLVKFHVSSISSWPFQFHLQPLPTIHLDQSVPAQWDCSFHQCLWVIQSEQGMCEPWGWWTLWNFPRKQQQAKRSTRVKTWSTRAPWRSLVYGSCSSLTQQTPSTFGKDMHSQITSFFHPCVGNFTTAALPWWQHR